MPLSLELHLFHYFTAPFKHFINSVYQSWASHVLICLPCHLFSPIGRSHRTQYPKSNVSINTQDTTYEASVLNFLNVGGFSGAVPWHSTHKHNIQVRKGGLTSILCQILKTVKQMLVPVILERFQWTEGPTLALRIPWNGWVWLGLFYRAEGERRPHIFTQ